MTGYQNGTLSTGEPRSIQLTTRDQIQLDVGPPAPAQSFVTFPNGAIAARRSGPTTRRQWSNGKPPLTASVRMRAPRSRSAADRCSRFRVRRRR